MKTIEDFSSFFANKLEEITNLRPIIITVLMENCLPEAINISLSEGPIGSDSNILKALESIV